MKDCHDNPDYSMLEDEDIMQEGDLAFGNLANKKVGWGRIPPYLFNQPLCIGAVGIGHPVLVMRKKIDNLNGQEPWDMVNESWVDYMRRIKPNMSDKEFKKLYMGDFDVTTTK